MRWLFAVIILAGSGWFIATKFKDLDAALHPPPAPPPILVKPEALPAPLLGPKELAEVKASTANGDPGLRWSAIELLWSIKDPSSTGILERTIAHDPDPDMRIRAVLLLNKDGGAKQVPGLVKALSDVEMDVRLAALKALGDIGDPAAAPYVAALLKDPENQVKEEALRTLGRFQDKRTKEFEALTARLRRQYEDAVRKSRGENNAQ